MVAVQHFDAMDDHGQKLQDLESALGLASAFEQFSQAADLKKELDDVNANDVVKQILEVTISATPCPCHLLHFPPPYASVTGQQCSFVLPVFTGTAEAPERIHCEVSHCFDNSTQPAPVSACLAVHNMQLLSLQQQHGQLPSRLSSHAS